MLFNEVDLDLAETKNYIELSNVKLHIYSDTLSQQDISSFLKNIIDLYEDKKNKEAFGTSLKILSWNNLTSSDDSEEDDNCDYQIFDNESSITFDNLILPSNTDMIIKQRLQYFNENKKIYVSKGKPYTFGLCLRGPPGTVKLVLLKLANETKRHICMISFDETMTLSDLQKIFYSNIKNGKKEISPKT